MVVLNTKSFAELRKEGDADLEAVGFSTSPGSIAKLFLNIINKFIGEFYEALTINHLRAFVTTADGNALDEIGVLLQCSRITNETDDNYRYRIMNQCLVLATSNYIAVRLAALTVDDVEDVLIKEYAMGAGTFAIIVITNNPDTDTVLKNVRSALSNVHAYGVRYTIEVPRFTPVKIKHHIYITDRTSDADKQEIRYNVQYAMIDYFTSLTIGQPIITDQITQAVMNVDSRIIQESNVDFYIDGERAIYTNQTCRWFERFMLADEADNVIIV